MLAPTVDQQQQLTYKTIQFIKEMETCGNCHCKSCLAYKGFLTIHINENEDDKFKKYERYGYANLVSNVTWPCFIYYRAQLEKEHQQQQQQVQLQEKNTDIKSTNGPSLAPSAEDKKPQDLQKSAPQQQEQKEKVPLVSKNQNCPMCKDNCHAHDSYNKIMANNPSDPITLKLKKYEQSPLARACGRATLGQACPCDEYYLNILQQACENHDHNNTNNKEDSGFIIIDEKVKESSTIPLLQTKDTTSNNNAQAQPQEEQEDPRQVTLLQKQESQEESKHDTQHKQPTASVSICDMCKIESCYFESQYQMTIQMINKFTTLKDKSSCMVQFDERCKSLYFNQCYHYYRQLLDMKMVHAAADLLAATLLEIQKQKQQQQQQEKEGQSKEDVKLSVKDEEGKQAIMVPSTTSSVQQTNEITSNNDQPKKTTQEQNQNQEQQHLTQETLLQKQESQEEGKHDQQQHKQPESSAVTCRICNFKSCYLLLQSGTTMKAIDKCTTLNEKTGYVLQFQETFKSISSFSPCYSYYFHILIKYSQQKEEEQQQQPTKQLTISKKEEDEKHTVAIDSIEERLSKLKEKAKQLYLHPIVSDSHLNEFDNILKQIQVAQSEKGTFYIILDSISPQIIHWLEEANFSVIFEDSPKHIVFQSETLGKYWQAQNISIDDKVMVCWLFPSSVGIKAPICPVQ